MDGLKIYQYCGDNLENHENNRRFTIYGIKKAIKQPELCSCIHKKFRHNLNTNESTTETKEIRMSQATAAVQSTPEFNIVPKGVTVEIKDKAGQSFTSLYVGAGWDMVGKPVDLDLVGAALSNGKLTAQTRLVYFGDKTEPGITLSEDNRTGAGDGDDESMKIDLSKIESDVDSIAIGVAAYSGADLATAKNFRFRIVNGSTAEDTQVFELQATAATAGDTVLHAANLIKGANGWTIENVSTYHKKGNGADAIKGFAGLFA